jgi:hypothetical protein
VPSNPARTVRWRAAENSAAKAFSPKAARPEDPGAECRHMRKIAYAELPVWVCRFSYRVVFQYVFVVDGSPDNGA